MLRSGAWLKSLWLTMSDFLYSGSRILRKLFRNRDMSWTFREFSFFLRISGGKIFSGASNFFLRMACRCLVVSVDVFGVQAVLRWLGAC